MGSESDGLAAVGSICATYGVVKFEREDSRMVSGLFIAVIGIVDSQFAVGIGHRVICKMARVSTCDGRRIKVINAVNILHVEHCRFLHACLRGVRGTECRINILRRAS